MIFRTLSRLIILVIGVVVLAELVSKEQPKESKPDGEPEDAEAEAETDDDEKQSEGGE
ncbi:MAG: hypothetical protein IIA27_08155 [Gemmatimonadetes bacterium]|nr:hypothetical protein [Gemmatimonadota bacterium]